MRVTPSRHNAKLVPGTRCDSLGTQCDNQLLCDQVTGVPRKHQIVDLPLIARAKVHHFVDVIKMVGHAVAIDLKITKIENRTSAPGRERLRSLLTVGLLLGALAMRLNVWTHRVWGSRQRVDRIRRRSVGGQRIAAICAHKFVSRLAAFPLQ